MSDKKLKASELILNTDGTIYHLAVKDEYIADNVIIVGDQDRVDKISEYFDSIEHQIQNREFRTHTGMYRGTRISVMSTGIGTDNIDIFLNELDAAVNIDLKTKEFKKERRILNIVRLGTTGSLHSDIPVGSVIISKYGLGLDGLMHFYQYQSDKTEENLLNEINKQVNWPQSLPDLYLVESSSRLYDHFEKGMIGGITATAPGFYAPQGRNIGMNSAFNDCVNRLSSFQYENLRITNFEMETSALYGLGKLSGHRCCTTCVVLANRATGEATDDHTGIVDHLIREVLNKISTL